MIPSLGLAFLSVAENVGALVGVCKVKTNFNNSECFYNTETLLVFLLS